MTKVITGLTGLVVTVALAGASAFALFSDTVTVTNAQISTGNADLQISLDNATWSEGINFADMFLLDGIFPGYTDTGTFYLRNNSDSAGDMSVSGLLASRSGNWNALKDKVMVTMQVGDNAPVTGSLAAWETEKALTPTNTLGGGEVVAVTATIMVDSTAGNEIANKTLSTNWEFTGDLVNATGSAAPTAAPSASVAPSASPTVAPTTSPSATAEPTVTPDVTVAPTVEPSPTDDGEDE